jgi:HlyD family secretion protein
VINSGLKYEVIALRRADVRVTVRATGTLEAITTVEVGAEVTGRLLSVNVDINDRVTKGEILATIDPEQLHAEADQTRAQLTSAQAAIQTAQATLVESKLAAARAVSLSAQGIMGKNDFETAIAAKARAEAGVSSAVAGAALAEAALKFALSKLDKATIISPIDGSVLARLGEPGQTVTAGFQTPVLFRLAQDLTRMRLNVDVDEADIGRVREGMAATFTVDAYADRVFASHVVTLYNESKTTQNVVTYQGVLAVDNTERLLRPGMTCTATIVSQTRVNVWVVPNAALRFSPAPKVAAPKKVGVENEKKQQRVFVLRANKPIEVLVVAGATDGVITEVTATNPKEPNFGADAMVIVDTQDAP